MKQAPGPMRDIRPWKKRLAFALAAGLFCALAGCQKSGLPKPGFPLEESVVAAAMEQAGLPGEINPEETQSGKAGHILYSLRDPARTYAGTENPVLTASFSSAQLEGGRVLYASFFLPNALDGFAWEDWREAVLCATRLFGGFADEEEVYRAFSSQPLPEAQPMPGGSVSKSFRQWDDVARKGGYCQAYLQEPMIQDYAMLRIALFEDEALFQKIQQEAAEARAALENARQSPEP